MRSMIGNTGYLEWMSFLLHIPVVSAWVNYILLGNYAFTLNNAWLISYPLIAISIFITGCIQVSALMWARKRFPTMKQIAVRVTLQALSQFILSVASLTALVYAYDAWHILDYRFSADDLLPLLWTALALSLIAVSTWEAEYTLAIWKKNIAEQAMLEQLKTEDEFEVLKNQVNPHFLFNCFNTLSSLITEDTKQAEIFLNELSKVYRYLLKNNEDGLSALNTEIRFIESYYKLLKTRHGEAVQLNINIDYRYSEHLLPSLSLQLLIENAVKHNVLSKNIPLKIEVFTVGNQLLVSNNLQLRSQKAPSNKVGLQNIANKYLLLKQQGFQVLKDHRSFTVALPLIRNKHKPDKPTTVTDESTYSRR